MKRLLTTIFAIGCLCASVMAADVYCSNPGTLEQGYTGEVTLTFWPSSGDPLYYETSNIYSHIGLLTSESVDENDVKYWGPGCTTSSLGNATEPKWTYTGWGTYCRASLTLSPDVYTYFGAPGTADITGIVVIMHDGTSNPSNYSYDEFGQSYIVPVAKPVTCTYTLLMRDEYSDSWNGGSLHIWDNGYRQDFTLLNGENNKPQEVDAYGGAPKGIWTSGTYDNEVGFDIIASGGKVIYTEEAGGSVASPFTLADDPCDKTPGDYTIANLKVADKGFNQYEFTWDANSKYASYRITVYDPDGAFVVGDDIEESNATLNLGTATKNGTFKVEVKGRDSNFNMFGGGASLTFPVTIKQLGATTCRMLIPSDCDWDVSKDIYFAWYGEDDVRHPVKMTQESGSRWWTVTTDISLAKFWYECYAETSATTRTIVHGGGYMLENSVCFEVGTRMSEYMDGGITYYDYYKVNAPCDAPDHDYSIASCTAKAEDGKLILSWTPKKDKGIYYTINVYKGTKDFLGYGQSDEGTTTYEWIYEGDEDITVTSWTIQAWRYDNMMMPDAVGKLYEQTQDVPLTNPYVFKNFKAEKGEENRYILSWDAYDNAKSFEIYATAVNPGVILSGTFEVGKQVKKVGNKFQISTDPLIEAGACNYYITAFDANAHSRAYTSGGWDATVEHIGADVTFSVLIPEDICFDVSNGVWFRWKTAIDPETWVKATKATDSHWYTATLGTVNATSFELTVGNNDQAHWTAAYKIDLNPVTGKNPKYYMYNKSSDWYLEKADEDTKDHNYIPQDVTVVPNVTTGELDITITAADKAVQYYVNLYRKGGSSYFSDWLTPKESETTTFNFTINPRAMEEVEIEKVVVKAISGSGSPYSDCSMLEKAVSFKVPQNPAYPKNLKAEANTDETAITFTWDDSDYADNYTVEVDFFGPGFADWNINTEFIAAKDGKRSVVLDELAGNGNYKFRVSAYSDGNWCGTEETTCTITKFKPLGDVNVRVLIPSDNNMDISGGVWLCYWFPGEERVANGKFVELKEKTAGSHWYECTFNETTKSAFEYVIVNADSWSGAPQCSYDSRWMTTNNICIELLYKTSWEYYYSVVPAACDAPDHDYRIDKVTVDNSKAGRATFTITPKKDIAGLYSLGYRKNGTTDPYVYTYSEEGATTMYVIFNNSVDTKYDFQIVGNNGYREASDPFEGTVDIKANTNVPTGLKATVADDGISVTFEWKKVGSDVAYYGIQAYDWGVGKYRLDVKNITTEKYEAQFLIPITHGWNLTAYNAEGEALSVVEGPSFKIIGADLSPKNLSVSVNGKKATFTWEAAMAVPMCYYEIFDTKDWEVAASGHVTGKDGKYTATFSLDKDTTIEYDWFVVAEAAKEMEISLPTYGSQFSIVGSKEDPAPGTQYTLNISAAVGGTVNEAVNGKWDKGAKVTLKATPKYMWEFDEWSDGNKNAVRKITMDKDYTLEAKFTTTASFTLKISSAGHGVVNESVNGTYKGGEKVTITANPEEGYMFGAWSDGDTRATREIIMVEDLELKAVFVVLKTYTIAVDVKPSKSAGKILFDGVEETGNTKTVNDGATVTVKAVPAEGYEFDYFDDGGTKITKNEHSVKVTSNTTITAYFKKKVAIYTLAVEVKPKDEAGKILFDGVEETGNEVDVEDGTMVTIKAVPADGYVFSYFDHDGTKITKKEYKVEVTEDINIIAYFKKDTEDIENITVDGQSATKVFHEGQIYIIREGKIYTPTGTKVK